MTIVNKLKVIGLIVLGSVTTIFFCLSLVDCAVRNNFEGDVEVYVEGVYRNTTDGCWGSLDSHYIGDTELDGDMWFYEIPPPYKIDAGDHNFIRDGRLVDGATYRIYKKPSFMFMLYDYLFFIECLEPAPLVE